MFFVKFSFNFFQVLEDAHQEILGMLNFNVTTESVKDCQSGSEFPEKDIIQNHVATDCLSASKVMFNITQLPLN